LGSYGRGVHRKGKRSTHSKHIADVVVDADAVAAVVVDDDAAVVDAVVDDDAVLAVGPYYSADWAEEEGETEEEAA
jgi:hypothetical protein